MKTILRRILIISGIVVFIFLILFFIRKSAVNRLISYTIGDIDFAEEVGYDGQTYYFINQKYPYSAMVILDQEYNAVKIVWNCNSVCWSEYLSKILFAKGAYVYSINPDGSGKKNYARYLKEIAV